MENDIKDMNDMEKKEYNAPEVQTIKIDNTALLDGGIGIHSQEGTGEYSKELGDISMDEDNESDD